MNTDCKSQANRIWGATVRYQTTRTGGTEHSPIFTSTVSLNDKSYSAIGSSRQDAEQAAAEALLRATNRGEYWLHTAAESTVVPDVMVTPLAPPSPGPVKLDSCNPTCFGYASPTGWDLHHSRSRPAVALVIDYGTVRYAPKAQYMPGVQIFPLLKAATLPKPHQRNNSIAKRFVSAEQYNDKHELQTRVALRLGRLMEKEPPVRIYVVSKLLNIVDMQHILEGTGCRPAFTYTIPTQFVVTRPVKNGVH